MAWVWLNHDQRAAGEEEKEDEKEKAIHLARTGELGRMRQRDRVEMDTGSLSLGSPSNLCRPDELDVFIYSTKRHYTCMFHSTSLIGCQVKDNKKQLTNL